MKEFFSKVWDFLDGNKTTIGTVIAYGARFIPEPTVATIVENIGLAIAGGGLVHKAQKSAKKISDKKKKD